MPTFTLEEQLHPNPSVGKCYVTHVFVPEYAVDGLSVRGYVNREFGRCCISRQLAIDLELEIDGDRAHGAISIQSMPELGDEGPVIHRSRPLDLKFRIASPKLGEAYIHFSLDELATDLLPSVYTPRSLRQKPFMVLKPEDPSPDYCAVIPIDRW